MQENYCRMFSCARNLRGKGARKHAQTHAQLPPAPALLDLPIPFSLFPVIPSAIFLKQIFSPLVYLTLVPVVAGVALASLKELDFKVRTVYLVQHRRRMNASIEVRCLRNLLYTLFLLPPHSKSSIRMFDTVMASKAGVLHTRPPFGLRCRIRPSKGLDVGALFEKHARWCRAGRRLDFGSPLRRST